MRAVLEHVLSWISGACRPSPRSDLPTEVVDRIAGEFPDVPPSRARYLAAAAYLVSRAARADDDMPDADRSRMVSIVQRMGCLSQERAARIVARAVTQCRTAGSSQDFPVTHELRRLASCEERLAVLECLFAASGGDAGISNAEEAWIQQIASELGFAHHHYIAVRMGWFHERNVLTPLKSPGQSSVAPPRSAP